MVKRPTPLLDALLARVRALLEGRGAQARLSDYLHVKSGRVSEWLSGEIEPGGEITLHLQKWVAEAEAKQKKTAAVRLTPRRRMARTQQADEDKKRPGR